MNCRKLLRKIALPLFFVLMSVVAFAQSQVTGRITDAGGAGIAGVTVTVKGTSTATSTNENGQFTINVPASGRILVFSSVGYGTREETINGRTSVDASLQTSGTNLNEVVVVAYGTRRRGDLTSSVTQVTAKDFQKGFQPSADQLLQGKVAGLAITSGGGAAGTGSRIRIRGGSSLSGGNDPLIVVDGIPVQEGGIAGSGNFLNTINPNDIESMSVLKDASATALYGSRASNGVIIITTKKGTKGKVRFNFNTQFSVMQNSKKASVLTGDQVRSILADDVAQNGDSTWFKLLGKENTDWQDQIYRTAFGSDNNLSASGAVANIPFRISGGYTMQEGTLKKNKFDRISTALSLTPKFLNDHLAVTVNAKYTSTKNNFSDQGAIGAAVGYDPTQPVYDADAKFNRFGGYREWLQATPAADIPLYGPFQPRSLANRNPVSMINLRDNVSTVNRFIGNVQLDYKLHFFPDLHVLANVGGDWARGSGHNNVDSLSPNAFSTFGSKSAYKQGTNNSLADVSLFYAKEIKSLRTKIDVLVGHSYQEFSTDVNNYASFSYRPIGDPRKPELLDTIETSRPVFATDKPTFALESYLGRININIADKYLLQGVLRRDASSKLNPNDRVGYFPGVSAAWKIREEFFRNSRVLNDLKLRASWGETGQQGGLGYYTYIKRYTQGNQSASYQFGNDFVTVLRPEGYVEDLRWETQRTLNFGLDFAFLNNRISGSIDYYKRKTVDLLADVPVAPGANFSNRATKNVGELASEGIELAINTTPVRNSVVTWDFNFNISRNKREIRKLLDYPDPNFKGIDVAGIGIATGNFIGKWIVGEDPSAFYVYKQVYDNNGKPLEGVYEDLNRDGSISADDRYLFKRAAPDFLLGLSTQIAIKKFTIGATAHGMVGNYLYNQYAAGSGILSVIKNPTQITSNASPSLLETGFKNNSNNQFLSDYFIQNASFLRIDNINLGYDLGRVFNNRAGLRVNASIQNVGVITNYRGLDPEVADDFGRDGNIYPRARTFTLGVNLDF